MNTQYKVIEALKDGRVVAFKSIEPRYYRMVDGVIYRSDINEPYTQWKKSNAKMSVFKDETRWIIL